jgi:hypothetical protein
MLSLLENIAEIDLFGDKVREGGLFLFLPLAHSFGRLIELAGPVLSRRRSSSLRCRRSPPISGCPARASSQVRRASSRR